MPLRPFLEGGESRFCDRALPQFFRRGSGKRGLRRGRLVLMLGFVMIGNCSDGRQRGLWLGRLFGLRVIRRRWFAKTEENEAGQQDEEQNDFDSHALWQFGMSSHTSK